MTNYNRHKAPEGECEFCDKQRELGTDFHPRHDPYPYCRSYKGGRNHCTCDSCW